MSTLPPPVGPPGPPLYPRPGPPPPAKRSNTVWIIVVVVLVGFCVLPAGCVGAVTVLGKSTTTTTVGAAPRATSSSSSTTSSADPSPTAPPTTAAAAVDPVALLAAVPSAGWVTGPKADAKPDEDGVRAQATASYLEADGTQVAVTLMVAEDQQARARVHELEQRRQAQGGWQAGGCGLVEWTVVPVNGEVPQAWLAAMALKVGRSVSASGVPGC